MEKIKISFGLSPTVSRVIEEFSAAMRADETIDNEMVDRLEQLLRSGTIPKSTEIKSTLFSSESEVES